MQAQNLAKFRGQLVRPFRRPNHVAHYLGLIGIEVRIRQEMSVGRKDRYVVKKSVVQVVGINFKGLPQIRILS